MTLSHPHGQIYAYPFLPPRVEKILGLGRAGTGSAPAATCSPTSSPPSARARGSSPPTSTGPRSSRPRPAGRTRCSCSRPARCPTSPALDRRRARRASSRSTSTSWRRFAAPVRHPDALHRGLEPGAGAARAARTGGCTCSCSRCAARPGKLKYLAGFGVGHGRVHHRHEPRGRRRAAADVVVAMSADRSADDGVRRAASAPRPRASGRRPAGSTSSASTPTTTTASCCRSPCRTPPAPRSAAGDDGRVALASLQGDGGGRRARRWPTWRPAGPTAGPATRPASSTGLRDRLRRRA